MKAINSSSISNLKVTGIKEFNGYYCSSIGFVDRKAYNKSNNLALDPRV